MISPYVLPRIEKWLLSLGLGVGASGEVIAATIATGTNKGQILGLITTAEGLGEEMVEGEQGCAARF